MMRLRNLFFWMAMFCAITLDAQDQIPKFGSQKAHKLARKSEKTVRGGYLLFLPDGYRTQSRTAHPLILFLHGMGERGPGVSKVKIHGPPKIAESLTNFPFIVLSPQCPPGEWWSTELVLAALDEVIKRHRVDTNRIYLTGLSMGGFGSWELALKYPERWAAVAPICGGGNPLWPVGYQGEEKKRALKNLPFWVFHGEKDPTVPLLESQRMVDSLKKFGCDVKFTVYPGVGHDSWTATYKNRELYDWFLEHRRK